MTDRDENFLSRWSRVKQQVAREHAKPDKAPAPQPGDDVAATETALAQKDAADSFDVSTLPPVESITAATDIRDFLRAGVPAELTKAALRKVWTSDPAIRDFIGIAENQWDFTDPNGIPGFGPMAPTDDVADLVAKAMGKLEDVKVGALDSSATEESQEVSSAPPSPVQSTETATLDASADHDNSAAAQQSADAPRPPRRHGGALPT